MAIKHFERGSSTYCCRVCKRNTRNTGDEGQSRLCSECWELSGIDNEISDNGGALTAESFTQPETVISLLKTLIEKTDVNRVRLAWQDTYIGQYIDQAVQ